jgi:hypothetical protein
MLPLANRWEVTVPVPTVAPGSMAPQDSMSGVILLFYIYEGSIRIFGFRKAIFDGSRIMDTLDISVILVSVIVYIVATLAQATVRIPEIIPPACNACKSTKPSGHPSQIWPCAQ